ncbi:MAG: PLP-dependent aminotransferase family protein [Dorea sp.]|jgi:DNA-binding transcriptional MocR family regulator|nr:PLP-dependent aminotransferase family protein [Dorea sp.]
MNELTMNLKPRSKIPLYEQIYSYIKTDIQCGRIGYREKLPSTRALSKHLEVSRSTVELAYEQLLSEGYIEAEPYRGFFVAQTEELYHLKKERVQAFAPKQEKKKYRYDFSPNGVDLRSFPYNAWRKLSKDILMDDRTELFRSGDSKGEYGFRNAISSYLHQARGVNCSPEQIIVGAGSDYILMLLSMLLGREHRIAFENPAYKQAYHMANALSYETVPVPLDKSGMMVSALEASGADIAYVTPSHQYPTGIVMPINRRMELLRWAAKRDGRYIVEDDYDSEYRYKGKPIPALQGYDAHEKVIYLGTFSRSVAPAIRLSYMVLPQTLMEAYERKNGFVHSTVSKVDQLIMQRFLEEGYYERHLNKTRALYKSRHDVLLEGLKPMWDILTVSGEHAGVHLLLTFQNGLTETELIQRAAKEDVRVYGLSDYWIGETKEEKPTILLGYANLTEGQIEEAVEILERCFRR